MLAIRAIPRDIPCIVSVSDTTYNENHTKPKYVIMCSNNKNILQGASLIIMKASELRPHLGYRLLGCQCTMKDWHQIVHARAITAYQSHPARRIRLEHEALSHVFKDWDVRTRNTMQLYWGGKTLRLSKVYLAAVVVDHPQLDKFAGSGQFGNFACNNTQ